MERYQFKLYISKYFILLQIALYSILLLGLYHVNYPLWLKLILYTWLLNQAYDSCIGKACMKNRNAVHTIWIEGTIWGCENNKGHTLKGKLSHHTYQNSLCIILHIKSKSTAVFIPIFKDALSDFEFRVLSGKVLYYL